MRPRLCGILAQSPCLSVTISLLKMAERADSMLWGLNTFHMVSACPRACCTAGVYREVTAVPSGDGSRDSAPWSELSPRLLHPILNDAPLDSTWEGVRCGQPQPHSYLRQIGTQAWAGQVSP